jgi:hypothetical protein
MRPVIVVCLIVTACVLSVYCSGLPVVYDVAEIGFVRIVDTCVMICGYR